MATKALDLTPFVRKYTIRPGNAWIFRMKFWQVFLGESTPLDVRSLRITAKLYQLVDGKWEYFLSVNQSNKRLDDESMGNYIYLDPTDDRYNSGVVFAADWLQEGNAMLDEGQYKLEFSYNSELSFPRSFATYLVDLSETPREDDPVPVHGIDFFLILMPEIVNINIYNTIINNRTSNT